MKALGAALLAAAAAGGCQPAPSTDGPYTLLETRPAESPATASMLCPLEEVTWSLTVVEGDATSSIDATRAPTDRYRASWVGVEGPEDRAREHYWAVTDDGGVVLTAVVEHAENALTLFDPPLPAAPATLAPGETVTGTARMRVVDSRRPRRQREAGTATQTITYVGDQRIRTPLGVHLARRIEIEFVADLRMADVEDRTVLLVVPDLGPVLEIRDQSVTILGVVPRRTERVLVRNKAES